MEDGQFGGESRGRATEKRQPDEDVPETARTEEETVEEDAESSARAGRVSARGAGVGGVGDGPGGDDQFVAYDANSAERTLSDRFGIGVAPDEVRRLAELESEFGADHVQRWVDEGMPVKTMGKPRDIQAYRERQEQRADAVPRDIERRNEASLRRNKHADRGDANAGDTQVPDEVRQVISSPGIGLGDDIQREMESSLGGDFGDVRVHTGPTAAAAAESINARAFTVGNHVAFNRGEYAPETEAGKRVLAHELTHVRQQPGGAVSLLPAAGSELVVDPDPNQEREAEAEARAVVADDHRTVMQQGAAMHVQRQPHEVIRQRDADGTWEENVDEDDKDGDETDEEEREGGEGISENELSSLVAQALRQQGIVAPEGLTLEEDYLDGISDGDVVLYLTGESIPVPPSEWILEEVETEGVAHGAQRAVIVRVHDLDDAYGVDVQLISTETSQVELSTIATVEKDPRAVGERLIDSLDEFESQGLEIREPTTDVFEPEPAEDEGQNHPTGPEEESEPGAEAESERKSDGEPEDEESEEDSETYEIKEGDTLWDLAQEHDVDGGWVRIWKKNEAVIGENPHLIFPGVEIQIPQGPAERSYTDVDVPEHDPAEVQPKLEVSSPNDPAEKEAERVAERLMTMDVDDLPGATAGGDHTRVPPNPRLVRTVPVSHATGGTMAPEPVESKVQRAVEGRGKSLPGETRSFFEQRFGADFSDVQVHTGPDADEAALSIQARAYTMGSNIAFAKGNYAPNTEEGKRLLAHELTHVVQQGRARTTSPPSGERDEPDVQSSIDTDQLTTQLEGIVHRAIPLKVLFIGGGLLGVGKVAWDWAFGDDEVVMADIGGLDHDDLEELESALKEMDNQEIAEQVDDEVFVDMGEFTLEFFQWLDGETAVDYSLSEQELDRSREDFHELAAEMLVEIYQGSEYMDWVPRPGVVGPEYLAEEAVQLAFRIMQHNQGIYGTSITAVAEAGPWRTDFRLLKQGVD